MDIQTTYPTGYQRQEALAARPSADELGLLKNDDSFSFSDFFDIINPLQQIPIVGSIYRSLSGETISAGARIAGGFLMGGPIGFMASAINAGIEAATGDDVVEHVIAMIAGSSEHQYAMNAYQKTNQLG